MRNHPKMPPRVPDSFLGCPPLVCPKNTQSTTPPYPCARRGGW